MAKDNKRQALVHGVGPKDWLESSGNQQCIRQVDREVLLSESFASVVTHDVAQGKTEMPRLKFLESAYQEQTATNSEKCDLHSTAGNQGAPEPVGTSCGSARNNYAVSHRSAKKRVLHDMSDSSLRKTQGTNLEIPYQIEAVAPKNLRFVPISKEKATELIIKHHYLRRKCPTSLAYGIKVGDETMGVLIIGKPNSYSACVGVTGGTRMDVKLDKGRWRDVFELNRLWVSDDLPPNTESRFIGWVLRELKRDYPNLILLSYADGEQNHVGYVYQATNWIYTGLSAKFEDRTLAGYNDHRSVPKGKLQGPNVIRKQRSRKHRYVMFLTPKDEGLLAWERLPYPKRAAR